jgi:hypothetical protein
MMPPGYPMGYPNNPAFPIPPQQPPRGVYTGGGMGAQPMGQQRMGYGQPQQQAPGGIGQPFFPNIPTKSGI